MADNKDDNKKDLADDSTAISVEEYNRAVSEARTLKTQLGAAQAQVTELESKRAELEDRLKKKPESASREEIEKQLRGEFQKQIDSLSDEKSKVLKALKNKITVERVMQSLGDEVISSAKPWIERTITEECDIDGDDLTNPQFVAKAPDGQARWSKTKRDERMSVEEYAGELKDRFPDFITSKMKGGSKEPGEKGSTEKRPGGSLTLEKAANMSVQDLTSYDRKDLMSLITGQ